MSSQTLLLSLALLVPSDGPAERIEFRPEPGLVLKKTIVTEQYLSLQNIDLLVDGEPQASTSTLELASTTTLAVTDQYLTANAGRTTSLRRVFDRISFDGAAQVPRDTGGGGGTRSARLEGSSALEGNSVVFTYVPETGEYGRYFDQGEPNEELLRDLREDLDFHGLLPSEPVAAGSEWELEPRMILPILCAAGDVQIKAKVPGEVALPRLVNTGLGGSLSLLLGETRTGRARAKFVRIDTVDGVRLAEISFNFSLETTLDQTALGRQQLSRDEMRRGVSLDSCSIGVGLSGKGKLLWALEEGHAYSLELEANGRMQRKETFGIPQQTRRGTMERTMGIDLDIDLHARFARP